MTSKNIVVGILTTIALVAGIFMGKAIAPAQPALGGALHEVREWFVNGLKIGTEGVQWVNVKVGDSADTGVLLTNTSNKDYFIDYGEIELIANASGTKLASSTFNVYMFATTTTSVLNSHDFTAVAASTTGLVIGKWATSTVATTTNSIASVTNGGQGTVRLRPNWSLLVYINRATDAVCLTGSCETATSTVRGFDIRARAHYHFDDN